jgi:putative ATP-dependent endonuclease of the OLD family
MKINHVRIRNFRTLESIDLDFPSTYTAICGPNDCGKTNVVRAIRALIKDKNPFRPFGFGEAEEVSLNEDYPKWKDVKPSQRETNLEIMLTIERQRDAGIFQFLTKQLSLNAEQESIDLGVTVSYRADAPEPAIEVTGQGTRFKGIEAQEVLKRLQSSGTILFHNSTQIDLPGPLRPYQGGTFVPCPTSTRP